MMVPTHTLVCSTVSRMHRCNACRQEMDAFRLYTVVPYLVKFIDQLTNIYVRYNRKRLKGKLGEDDSLTALCTLYSTLLTLCKVGSAAARHSCWATDFRTTI